MSRRAGLKALASLLAAGLLAAGLLAASLLATAGLRAEPAGDGPPLPPRRPAPDRGDRAPATASLPSPIDHPDRAGRPRVPERAGVRPAAEEPNLPLPGRFAPEPTRLPGHFLKERTVAPRTPDVQIDLSDRASLGAFGEVSQNPAKQEGGLGPTPTRPVQGLDVGAGVTLQYRFPTR